MKIAYCLFVALILSCVARGEQTPLTAERLMKGCENVILLAEKKKLDAPEMALASQATHYIDGYIDAIAMIQGINPLHPLIHLPAGGPKLSTYIREVAAFIRANPELRKEGSARVAVMLALKHHHPTSKSAIGDNIAITLSFLKVVDADAGEIVKEETSELILGSPEGIFRYLDGEDKLLPFRLVEQRGADLIVLAPEKSEQVTYILNRRKKTVFKCGPSWVRFGQFVESELPSLETLLRTP